MSLTIKLYSYFRLRRNKHSVVRAIFAVTSIFAIFLLLSRTIKSNGSRSSSSLSSSSGGGGGGGGEESHGDVFAHPLRSSSRRLSAEELKHFQDVMPVVAGWGDDGKPVTLQSKEELDLAAKQFKAGAFNVYISDRMSVNRSLPDARPYECSKVSYELESLGTASVVIIFTNEIWSALIRTLWSVWNRTPDVLLKEIILVDDFSDRKDLGDDLVNYCSHYFGDRVRIFRLPKREGLIRARLVGAEAAKGDVIVFLDSHCEVTVSWLEPMLQRIKEDPTNVVCPVIDVISDKTMEYFAGNPYYFQVGGFTWSGHFTWIDIDEEATKKNPTKAVVSPTMAGGLFAMNKKYFFDVGSYDQKMEVWGGENLEMSFRIWQCGGRLEIHPCSHVGHIFRDYHPYSFGGKDTHGINTLRTVMVWMDEYKKYFFMHRNDLEASDPGDISDRLKLKKQLKCKSFRWYLENVYGGKKYIYDKNVRAYGYARNPKSSLCLDVLNRDEEKTQNLGLFSCSMERPNGAWTNQVFSFTNEGEIRREESCATVNAESGEVEMGKCLDVSMARKKRKRTITEEKRKQLWKHTKGGQIINVANKQCLSTSGAKSMSDVTVQPCQDNDLHQIWWFQTYTDVNVVMN